MGLKIAFLIFLFILSFAIFWQDFKSRLVSIWILVAYSTLLISYTLYQFGFNAFLQNSFGAVLYFGLCFAVVFGFYFLKERQIPKIMDAKFGWADAIICFAIGISLSIIQLILFFTFGFVISAGIGLVFHRQNKTIPLAGILVILYLIFICILTFFPLDLMVLNGL